MSRILTLIFIFVSLASYPQIPGDFPEIGNNDLPEAKFQPPRHFTGESLFGYMNGGAELYREYGISDAVITEFDLGGGHYKCEVFKMTGPEEAYGIFSVSRFKCLAMPDLAEFTCQTSYQLQICKGSYYINIINRSGTSADSVNSVRIGKILTARITEPSADLSLFNPDVRPDDLKRSAVLAKGKLGLMNGSPLWEDYFRNSDRYYTLIYTSSEKPMISVRFRESADFQQFIAAHGWSLCDLSIYDLKVAGDATIRLLGENHLLIKPGQ